MLAFIGTTVLILPLLVFLPHLILRVMEADAEVVIGASGKNGHVGSVFRSLVVAMAGLVLSRAVDPVTARQVIAITPGTGV
jgi:hypothetical protein